jgi:hypothetical protein
MISGSTRILETYQEISWICLKITTVPGSGISCDGLLVDVTKFFDHPPCLFLFWLINVLIAKPSGKSLV